MAVDMIARLMAMRNGGGSVDAYTKAQTDTLLDGKVDKETGKGLSANDFTDAYKAAVDGAAPQETTYTKDETDALLGEKAPQSTTYTKTEVDTSQAMQDARILSLEQRVDNRIEHYGMKWEKENSDPQARCTYLYDCSNFTPMQCQNDGSVSMGSWANAFFIRNNYPAMVKPDGTIDYLLNPNDHSKKLDGTASHVEDHDTDNAMAVFDCHIWIKMAEDETYQYIEVANQKLDDDFVDFPYHRTDGTVKDKLYYPMFEGSIIDGKLRSLATGAVPQSNTTATEEQTAAQANGTNWSIGDWSHYLWLTCLSMLVGKTTCVENALGEGNTDGGSDASGFVNNGSLLDKGAFWGKPRSATNSENNLAVKLFFIENPYANRWKRILGLYNANGTYYVKTSPPYTIDETYDAYEDCGALPSANGWVKYLKVISCGLLPSTIGASATTYEGTYHYRASNASDRKMLLAGGCCSYGSECGFWCLNLNTRPSGRAWGIGASLYLM